MEESIIALKAGKDKDMKDQEDLLTLAMSGRVLTSDRLKTYSPLSFAYIGDAVFELLVRTMIVTRGNTKASRYHHEAIRYVNAKAQADLAGAILPELNDEEMKIYRRGLNAKPATTAKNQTKKDYRKATALETLIGYLYLRGDNERILSLLQMGFGIE